MFQSRTEPDDTRLMGRKMSLVASLLAVCSVLALAFIPVLWLTTKEAQAAGEIEWFVHAVDDYVYQEGTSLAFDPSGNPAISYISGEDLTVKLARWNGSSWDIESVDSTRTGDILTEPFISWSNEGKTFLDFDPSGNPGIVYHFHSDLSLPDAVLKYAHWNGSSWDIQDISPGRITDISFAFDSSGNPGITYQTIEGLWPDNIFDLNYARWNGLSWDIQVVPGTVSDHNSLTFDESDNPIIISMKDDFQYARWDGSSWDSQLMAFPQEVVYWSGSSNWETVALDSSGNPYVVQFDTSEGELKCLHWDGLAWDVQTVDYLPGEHFVCHYIALSESGNPVIIYYGFGQDRKVNYAAWDGTSWHTKMLDSGDEMIGGVSLKSDSSGNPALCYLAWSHYSYESSEVLKFINTIQMGNPDEPDNVSPANGATGAALDVTLESSAFSDPTASDSHVASQWQVTYVPGDYSDPVFDSRRTTVDLNQIAVPQDTLTYAVTYYWRVRYQDNTGNWSRYSSDTSFITVTYAYAAPDADFSALPATVSEGETVVFTDLSSGSITSWQWDLGDGTTVEWTPDTRPEDGKLSHVYTTEDSYSVSLTVRTLGGSDIESKEGYISVGESSSGFSLWIWIAAIACGIVIIFPVGIVIRSRFLQRKRVHWIP